MDRYNFEMAHQLNYVATSINADERTVRNKASALEFFLDNSQPKIFSCCEQWLNDNEMKIF